MHSVAFFKISQRLLKVAVTTKVFQKLAWNFMKQNRQKVHGGNKSTVIK